MYLQKAISKQIGKKLLFVGILEVTDEKEQDPDLDTDAEPDPARLRKTSVRIQGSQSGSVPKCLGSGTLVFT
jgi:hypothetical protein